MKGTGSLLLNILDRILQVDIDLINLCGSADPVIEIMAAEHGARVEALCKMIDPIMGKAILLLVANGLLKASVQIETENFPSG
jgi:hypothetical protein